MTHLLVTNDFPPKVGGIQSYLYELWRRLPPDRFAVLTIDHPQAAAFDALQPFRIRRLADRMLLPKPSTRREIDRYAREIGASHVVLDPALPIGLVGPRLALPYSLILHGAEISVPARTVAARPLLRRALQHAEILIAAGSFPTDEARRVCGAKLPPVVSIPPGVDTDRFHPLDHVTRSEVRERFGIADDAIFIVSVSRLVPRKGMDVLIKAVGEFVAKQPKVVLAIGGTGRDRARLERLAGSYPASIRFLGRVSDDDLAPLYGCADLAAMCCRNRWLGLEQEGFGIVFLEAAAAGIAVVAGASGGASEAVLDGKSGLVVQQPKRPGSVVEALARLVTDQHLRASFGAAGRARAVAEFDYDLLAHRLDQALLRLESS